METINQIIIILSFPLGIASYIIAGKKNRIRANRVFGGIIPYLGLLTTIILIFLPRKENKWNRELKSTPNKTAIQMEKHLAVDFPMSIVLISLSAFIIAIYILYTFGTEETTGGIAVISIVLMLIILSWAKSEIDRRKRGYRMTGILSHKDAHIEAKETGRCNCERKQAYWKRKNLRLKDGLICPVCGNIICKKCLVLFYSPEKRQIISSEYEELINSLILTYEITESPYYICFHNECYFALTRHLNKHDYHFPLSTEHYLNLDQMIAKHIKNYKDKLDLFPESFVKKMAPYWHDNAFQFFTKTLARLFKY